MQSQETSDSAQPQGQQQDAYDKQVVHRIDHPMVRRRAEPSGGWTEDDSVAEEPSPLATVRTKHDELKLREPSPVGANRHKEKEKEDEEEALHEQQQARQDLVHHIEAQRSTLVGEDGGEDENAPPVLVGMDMTELTEEEKALLRSLSHASSSEAADEEHHNRKAKENDGNNGQEEETEDHADGCCPSHYHDPPTPLEESMDEHDYLMMAETLREVVGNPLLHKHHDPTLATSDGGLGVIPDLAERLDGLLAGAAHGATGESADADWAERRTHRRRHVSPPPPPPTLTSAVPLHPPTEEAGKPPGSSEEAPPSVELRPLRTRRRRDVVATGEKSVTAGATVVQDDDLRPPRPYEEVRASIVCPPSEDMLMMEPSPCDLAGLTAGSHGGSPTSASPRGRTTTLTSAQAPTVDIKEEENRAKEEEEKAKEATEVNSSSSSSPASHDGGDKEQAAPPATATSAPAPAPPRRLKLKLGVGTANEEEGKAPVVVASKGLRLKLKGATAAPTAASPSSPPLKGLRLGRSHGGPAAANTTETAKEATTEASGQASHPESDLTKEQPVMAPAVVGSPADPGSPSVPVFSPRGQQRPPPIVNPTTSNSSTAASAAPASSSSFTPTTTTTTTTATYTAQGKRADMVTFVATEGRRRLPGSPLSPRRVTDHDALPQQQQTASPFTNALVAATGGPAVTPGSNQSTASSGGVFCRRSKTPTPTPNSLYNLSDATPHRTHPATKVPLPLAPIKVDFSTVSRYVEDTYAATEKISEGTYGEVYKGRVKATGEPVALKRLKTLRGLDGFPITSLREVIALQHIDRQRRRLRALAQERYETERQQPTSGGNEEDAMKEKAVADPLEEIIELRDVLLSKEATHDIYLVFSYANSSLAGLLVRRFPFVLPDIAYLFRKIVQGVKKLHDMGIIHRDIKTDNVLVSQDGAVQLADFGLCVFEGSGARALTPSMINLSYRPPEMLLGSTRYDAKVDVWSIGCLLAQVFLHHPPFYRRRNQEEQARAARHNRSAETELEQLATIAEVLGPITDAPADAFPASTCAHLEDLRRLQEAVAGASGGRAHYFSSPTTRTPGSGDSSNSNRGRGGGDAPGLSKMEALFRPSFSYGQFRGFRRWFASQMDSRRTQYILSSGQSHGQPPPPPLLLPSPACMDVLEAIFQYDPRRRPTAAQLLDMPLFQLYDAEGAGVAGGSAFFAPPTTTLNAGGSHSPEFLEALQARELKARTRLAERLGKVRDSHLQPQQQQQGQPPKK